MDKEIVLRIKVDTEKDEFGNLISIKGFKDGEEMQNTIFLIGLLEVIKQQEIKRVFFNEVKK